MSPPSRTPPSLATGMLIHDVARLFRRRFEQVARLRQLGLTRAQASVLIHLDRNEGINQVSLAQLMELEPITLVRLLDRLQAAGFVERRADPLDRRARNLYLTEPARSVLVRIEQLGAEMVEEALAGVAEIDRRTLQRVLENVKSNLLAHSACAGGDGEAAALEEVVNG